MARKKLEEVTPNALSDSAPATPEQVEASAALSGEYSCAYCKAKLASGVLLDQHQQDFHPRRMGE